MRSHVSDWIVPFQHQHYSTSPPRTDVAWLVPPAPERRDSAEWNREMQRLGAKLRRAGVSAIYLLHGTFVGDDLLGIVRLLSLVSPQLGELLGKHEKRLADSFVGDAGNYTSEYADLFAAGINQAGETPIPVRLLTWCSENNHLGRADGAVQFLDELTRTELPEPSRIMVWGHSHGGNVLALVSNLLAADFAARNAFFEAARAYWQSSFVCASRREPWERLHRLLTTVARPLGDRRLDVATFGTPIRYGWHPDGYGHLLHFVQHRPCPDLPAWQARFPFSLKSAARAKRGDYVHQVGIAGTNFPPPLCGGPASVADRRLNHLLQPGLHRRHTWQRMKAGLRVADAGETLLIDYQPAAPRLHRSAHGHAIYTRLDWLLYHARMVIDRWY